MDMNNVSIQGDIRYINYQFDFFTFPVLVALIPIIYLLPTVILIIRICIVYWRRSFRKGDETMNPHVFLVIVTSQITSFFYMISDYITFRIPFTGIITSWCASQEPNHFLKSILFVWVYFTYISWLFPFLLSALRLIPVYFPRKNTQLCAGIVKCSIPLIYLYPFPFIFTLIPALGFCRQLLGPYQFGAIYIFFSGNWFDVKLGNGLVVNLLFWLILSTISNLMLYCKLKKLKNNRKSVVLQRAELSITLTTLCMLLSYLTNLFCALIYLLYPPIASYFIALHPFGNDCETVFVPWIFYLTHPTFKKKRVSPQHVSKVATLHGSY